MVRWLFRFLCPVCRVLKFDTQRRITVYVAEQPITECLQCVSYFAEAIIDVDLL